MKSAGETIVQLNYKREEGDTEEVRTVVSSGVSMQVNQKSFLHNAWLVGGVPMCVPAQHCFFWKAHFLLLSTKPRESYLLLKGHSPESNTGLP